MIDLQTEFDYYNDLLIEWNMVQHIKDNYDTCSLCKNVADLHSMCAKFNEVASATFFIEAVKEYLNNYGPEIFFCKGCGCEVNRELRMRTYGYCYLCDPKVTLNELLDN